MNDYLWCTSPWGGAKRGVSGWARYRATSGFGCETNVVETGTLVVKFLAESTLEHDLDFSIMLIVGLWNDHGDMVDLVFPSGVETDVSGSSLALNTKGDSLTSSGASVLVLVRIEPSEVDLLSVKNKTEIVSVGCVPTVDLIEIELELNIVGVARDIPERFEGVPRVAIMFAVSPKEFGEDGSTGDLSVGSSL